MSHQPRRRTFVRAIAAAGSGILIAASALVAAPALAAPAPEEVVTPGDSEVPEGASPPGVSPQAVSSGAAVVINEVYGGGGNSGATYTHDFVELRNVSDADVDLAGWSVQYASATGSSWNNMWVLDGVLEAGGYALLQGAGGANGVALPTPDLTSNVNLSGSAGKVALVNNSTQLSSATGIADLPQVVDLVGFGSNASAYAGSGPAPAPSSSTSVSRNAESVNTANNSADFTAGAPSPVGGDIVQPPDPDPQDAEIAEVRAGGFTDGRSVTTQGVVTAHYPTGGFNGYVIQTPGTGGDDVSDRSASDAIFIFSSATVGEVEIGDYVQLTGTIGEFNGLGQISVAAGGVTVLDEAVEAPKPLAVAWPETNEEREAIESMLIHPEGEYTISNTYNVQFAEIGVASGDKPPIQPTQVGTPGSPEAAAQAADNAARGVIVDDGSSWNYLNQATPPPYVNLDNPLRVGAPITFSDPMVVDYRNNSWKLNPTTQVTAADADAYPVSWTGERPAAPAEVGGDITVASFNVLNYFTTLGADTAGCVAYTDRDGNGVTVREGCSPRGAWGAEDLERQQTKIVEAINTLDASIVGLMEIENSAKLGEPADEATATLADALNAKAGTDKWAYVPSSGDLPDVAQQDVITNAIIYQPAEVTPEGAALALGDQSGTGQPFVNAREPIGQTFVPAGGDAGDSILVVVNHFKSKGSAGPFPGDGDAGDGQSFSNGSRVLQATALRDWVGEVTEDGDAVALLGDFNSYAEEDPLHVLYDAGYTNAEVELGVENWSYSFQGLSGSLDHVLLNEAALERATGADIWSINSGESIALEYSRYNNYAADYYEPTAYRSSDHDPVVVGLSAAPVSGGGDATLRLLNINDFHGRIDGNTVNFAGTIEQQRAEIAADGGSSVFLSAGDNIGASLFASALAKDQPTIDVLNALDLAASAVGNHEFDLGYADLIDRVIDDGNNAQWPYLGANVTFTDTGDPALPSHTIIDVDGLAVGVIGAVTQETPTLVSPGGIENLTFGDPVEAVNEVAAQLSDGDPANGEADVIVAEYHDGAGAGTPDGSTLEEEVAAGGTFARIVTETVPAVDVIFTGHTHKQYAWDAPVPGADGETRPIVQTGSYGEFIGQVDLVISDGEVVSYTAANIARTTTPAAELIATFPVVKEVDDIVKAALAEAEVIGGQPVGEVTADITTAYIGGSYVGGVHVGPDPANPSAGRDDRASESTLGNLVADSLVASLSDPATGGAEIGVVNPGGLRNELFYAPDGVVTYAEANAVLPFVNNLWTTTLTGEQFKVMLEQQWQTNPDGSIPSRPYLQLGLSSNVSYTFDDSRELGDKITSVTIDGVPLDPAAEYRIGSFSFLLQGGDNFRIFTEGTDTRDSGLVDRDAWIAYIEANSPLSPDFARRSVAAPAIGEVEAGSEITVDVSKLDLTSLGSPENTEVSVSLGEVDLGTFPVTGGAATITVTIPADTAPGAAALTVVADPSGTTATLPLTVTEGPGSSHDLGVDLARGRDDLVGSHAPASGPPCLLRRRTRPCDGPRAARRWRWSCRTDGSSACVRGR
ncbi:ExeM/NucH family extracellular endonuclease [Salana multivorans]